MLPFGIGTLELAAILLTAVLTLTIFIGRFSYRKWSAVILGCVTLAAILTPSDVFSMLLMATAFVAVYCVGTRHHAETDDPHDHIPNPAN